MDYGASVGGPIFKNKTFFFGTFERYTQNDFRLGGPAATVPTPAFLGGDFSALLDTTQLLGTDTHVIPSMREPSLIRAIPAQSSSGIRFRRPCSAKSLRRSFLYIRSPTFLSFPASTATSEVLSKTLPLRPEPGCDQAGPQSE